MTYRDSLTSEGVFYSCKYVHVHPGPGFSLLQSELFSLFYFIFYVAMCLIRLVSMCVFRLSECVSM